MARPKPLKNWSRQQIRAAQNKLLNALKRQSWIPKGAGAVRHLLPEGTVVQKRWLVPYFTYIGKKGVAVKQKRYAVATKVRWAFGQVEEQLDENGIAWVKEFVDPVTGETYIPRLMTVVRWPKSVPPEGRKLSLYQGVDTSTAFMRYRLPTTQEWHPLVGPSPSPEVARALVGQPCYVASFDQQGNLLAQVFQEPRELIHSGLWRLLSKGNQNIVHPGSEVHFTTRGETLRQALARIPFQPVGWGSVGRLEAQFIAVDGKPIDMSDRPLVATNFCFTAAMGKGSVPMGPGYDSLKEVRRDLETQLQTQLVEEGVRSSSDDTLNRLMGQVEDEIMMRDLSTSREYQRWLQAENRKPSRASETAYKKELTKQTLRAYKRRKEILRHASIEIGMVLKLTHLSVLEDPEFMTQKTVEQELAAYFHRRSGIDGRGAISKKTALALIHRANEIVKKSRRKRK